MTNDQFKLLVYATALLGVALVEGKTGGFEQNSSFQSPAVSSAPYSWQQPSVQHVKPQDSPWIWLDEKNPRTQQIAQKKQKKKEEISVSQQPAQSQSSNEGDKVYTETSPVERIEMMEKMRQFRLERQEEDQDDPVRL